MLIIFMEIHSFTHSINWYSVNSLICAVYCNGKSWWFSSKRTVIRAKDMSSPLGRVLVNEELFMSSESNVSSAFGKCWLNSGPENYSHFNHSSQLESKVRKPSNYSQQAWSGVVQRPRWFRASCSFCKFIHSYHEFSESV